MIKHKHKATVTNKHLCLTPSSSPSPFPNPTTPPLSLSPRCVCSELIDEPSGTYRYPGG